MITELHDVEQFVGKRSTFETLLSSTEQFDIQLRAKYLTRSISVCKRWFALWSEQKVKQLKFMLLDVSRVLHITESTVSISYTFCY
jgi:hypothetical protein